MDIINWEDEIQRDRGILTPRDRQYLVGQTDLKAESERQVRQRIRDRLKNSVRDFMFIRWCLSERDREAFADDLYRDAGSLWQGYINMLSFFYRLNIDRGYRMESDLYNAIKSVEDQLEEERGQTIEIDIDIVVDRQVIHDHSDLKDKYEENDPMTPEEFQTLLFDSDHYDHLSLEERWERFGQFLKGETEQECVIEDDSELSQL